ncbi:MAG: sensor histidine kinase [Bacteriovoracaceae bacterium]
MIYIKLAKFHSVVLLFSLIGLFIIYRENLHQFPEAHALINVNRQILFTFVPVVIVVYLIALWFVIWTDEHIGKVMEKISGLENSFSFSQGLKLAYQPDEWTKIEATLEKAEEAIVKQFNELEIEHQKIKTMLSTINDGILALDRGHNLLFFNEQFRRYPILQENILKNGTVGQDLRHGFLQEEILEAYQNALQYSKFSELKQWNLIGQNGVSLFFDIVINPLKDSQGKVVGALGVFHDVTEHKLAEQMRVDFVANVSHEVRTPLTSIKGYTQLLKGNIEKIPEDLHDFVEKILMNSERVTSLFSDLLDLSVIESHVKVPVEDVDVKTIIQAQIHNLKPILEKKKIEVTHELSSEYLFANKRLLEQVVTNLIDNAVRYCPMGSLIIVKTEVTNEMYRFSFKDNGPGIAPEHQKRIFERFFRIDNTREQHEKGTGIGLSLVKHIVQKHKGMIWVEGEKGFGATFIFEIPRNLEEL